MTRMTFTARSVGVEDAEAGFCQLLDSVERGETIVIVRHGEPVARLVPFGAPIDKAKVDRAIERLSALREHRTQDDDCTIEDLINEGREP